MKNRIIIGLIATVINISLFAQIKNDSVKVLKNEIGVNLIPMINNASFGTNHKPIANVFFKRQLKNNWYGRVSVILFKNNGNNYERSLYVRALPNSKLGIEYSQNNSNHFLQYNIGIEKRFGKSKIKQFTGCDVGYAHYKTENKLLYGIRDSLENISHYNQSGFQNQTDSVIYQVKKTSNAIVLTPFYGMQFYISKHFFFSTQAGISLGFVNENNKSIIDNQINKIYVGTISTFDLNLSSVSCNFSICYRF